MTEFAITVVQHQVSCPLLKSACSLFCDQTNVVACTFFPPYVADQTPTILIFLFDSFLVFDNSCIDCVRFCPLYCVLLIIVINGSQLYP